MKGPVWTGGFEHETVQGYRIQFLADVDNDQLQRAGKAPVYYYMPSQVRLARKDGDGDYKFHLIHFVGIQNPDTTVGIQEVREVAGGVLSFTTTADFPAGVLAEAEQQLLERFRGNDDKYWGWRTPVAPMFRAVPISANVTAITNLTPDANGFVPADGGGIPVEDPVGPNDPPPSPGLPPRSTIAIRPADMTGRVMHGRGFRDSSNLDAWHWKLQGQGPGSLVTSGENAYSGLIGDLPAAIVWHGFHGVYSPIAVVQALKIPVWSQTLEITVKGNWDRIFNHFSTHAKAGGFWWSADIKAELNRLQISGGIEISIKIDETAPNADQMKQEITKRIDAIYNKFMEHASKVIFDPQTPTVTPAQASGGGGVLGWGGKFALNYRRDSTSVELSFSEKYDACHNIDHVISSTLEGFYDEIKQDPSAERKYFTTLFLDDWSRKVTRFVKPVVNWPDPSKRWIGDPVQFLSVEFGYPSAAGDIQWAPHVFQSTDTGDTTHWQFSVSKKGTAEVVNPPEGWTPDQMFVRRVVHLNEPPGENDSPYMRVFVEKNRIELDGPNGQLTSDHTVEIRADSVGKLEVGPITLTAVLSGVEQMVEVEFQCLGNKHDGTQRNITKFTWRSGDQDVERYWEIFTGQLDFVPNFRYRVRVIVRGTIFSQGMEWTGPWVEASGNGPLIVTVPTADAPGVTRRSLIGAVVEPVVPVGGNGGVGRPAITGGPPPRTVANGGSRGLAMRDLEPSVAVLDHPQSRMVGGYSLDPTAPRTALPPPLPSRGGYKGGARTTQPEPQRLEPAEGWWPASSTHNGDS